MKKLKNFYQSRIFERRQEEEVEDIKDIDPKDYPDKVVGKNGRLKNAKSEVAKIKPGDFDEGAEFALEPPIGADADGSQWLYVDPDTQTENSAMLFDRFQAEDDFFVQGEAGWGKTALITKVAHKFGYTVLTVYLDKIDVRELEGAAIPVADEDNKGGEMKKFLPSWAQYVLVHKDTKFFIFFDEMNQAPDDVQNALMPIILKHNIGGRHFSNILCGAAGNFKTENRSVSDLSGPLKSRLHPDIWETHTAETWAEHFEWAHEQYDDSLGADLIDEIAELQEIWSSPRDLEKRFYKYIKTISEKLSAGRKINDKVPYFGRPHKIKSVLMENCIWGKAISKAQKTDIQVKLDELCEHVCDFLRGGGAEGKKRREEEQEEEGRRGRGNMDLIDPEDKKNIMIALQRGFMTKASKLVQIDGGIKLLTTVENIVRDILDPEEWHITAEMINKIVKEMEEAGKKPKYVTNADAKKDPKTKEYVDPATLEDEED